MFTDIKGFTARVSGSSRDDLNSLLHQHAYLLLPVFRHFGGTVVKEIGDAFLVRFDASTNAVLCGVAIQEVLRQHNGTVAELDRIHIRVAINAGDVELSDGDILGEPVNIAARLEAIAEPGEVFFTEAVYLTMNRSEAPATAVGEHTFKGIPYPVRVFQVLQPDHSPLRQRISAGVRLTPRGPVITGFAAPEVTRSVWRPVLIVIALLAVAIGLYGWMRPTASERALRQAQNSNSPTEALDIVAAALRSDPDHTELRDFGIDLARRRLKQLRATSGSEALRWLRTEMERRPFLDPLRDQIPTLEAEEAAEADSPSESCRIIVRRYANSSDVPYAAAERLRARGHLWALPLYHLAYTRGRKPDDHVFHWICKMYERFYTGHITAGQTLCEEFFPKRFLEWSQAELRTTTNPRLLNNIVTVHRDAEWLDVYYRELSRCLQGSMGDDAYVKSLQAVLAEKDPVRRQQAIALHEATVKSSPSRRARERCTTALKKLRVP